jgi:glycosyltransferase involved in cell wall biosynthesis
VLSRGLGTEHELHSVAVGGAEGATYLGLAVARTVARTRPDVAICLGTGLPLPTLPTLRLRPPGDEGPARLLAPRPAEPSHGAWQAWGLAVLPHVVDVMTPHHIASTSQRVRVLVPGAISGARGQHLVAEALRGLSPSDRGALDVRFVGPTGEPDAARALERRLQGDAARREDEVADWPGLLRETDLVVLASPGPSRWGRTAVEALAAGCPVLHGHCPVLDEAVGGAGIAVPAGDVKALGEALRKIAREPDRLTDLRARALLRAESWAPAVALAPWHAALRRATMG